eukprot:scpid63805/ scgid28492/ 
MEPIVMNTTEFGNLSAASWACYSPLNATFCLRHSTVTALAIITLLLVFYKLFFFHYRRHSLWHQYLIFCAAGLECILLFIHWILVAKIELAFVALFLKSVQALTVVYFYCSLAAHQLRHEKTFIWVFVPVLGLIFLYFIAALIYALSTTAPDHSECYDISWIQFASGEIALSLVFLLAGVQITRKINSIRMSSSSRRSQKMGLWAMITAFFASSICAVTVDVFALTNPNTDCERILGEQLGGGDTARYIIVRIFRYLLPIWAMIFVFKVPEKTREMSTDHEEPHVDVPYRPVNDYYGSVSALPGSTPTDETRGLLHNNTPPPNGSFTQFPPSFQSPVAGR